MLSFKKTVFTLTSLVAFSNAQNGAFLGLDFGINTNRGEFLKSSNTLKTPPSLDTTIGVKTGYQQYINNFVGFRAYLGANYILTQKQTVIYSHQGGSGAIKSEGDMQYHGFNISGNVDALLKYDFSKNFALGVYGGIGYEGTFYNDSNVKIIAKDQGALELFGKVKNIRGSGFIYNVGIHTLIAQKHQVELGIKFAPYYIRNKSELSNRVGNVNNLGENSKALAGNLIFAGYRYLF